LNKQKEDILDSEGLPSSGNNHSSRKQKIFSTAIYSELLSSLSKVIADYAFSVVYYKENLPELIQQKPYRSYHTNINSILRIIPMIEQLYLIVFHYQHQLYQQHQTKYQHLLPFVLFLYGIS
jgi:hypothetical protein